MPRGLVEEDSSMFGMDDTEDMRAWRWNVLPILPRLAGRSAAPPEGLRTCSGGFEGPRL